MASPNENIEFLKSFWDQVNSDPPVFALSPGSSLKWEQYAVLGRQATNAMDELMKQAAANEHVRSVFAASHLFSTALLAEPGVIDQLYQWNGPHSLVGWRVPRLVMLQGIQKASVGGFISATDPKGLTSWIGSVGVAGTALATTLTHDPNGEVRLAAMDCLLNVSIPVVWATEFLQNGTIEKLEAELPYIQFSTDAAQQVKMTTKLAQGAAQLKARMQAVAALAQFAKLPMFPTGDGKLAATAPGAPRAWYKRGELWGSVAGLVLGGLAQAKLNKRVSTP